MDTVQAIVAIVILWNLPPESDMSTTDVINIKEGSTATLDCFDDEINETIRCVSWAVNITGSREAIATSLNSDENSPECNKENVIRGISNCTVFTEIHPSFFTSQLTLRDVGRECGQAVIECIMVDEEDKETDIIWIIKSFNLNVYHLSSDVRCGASLDMNNSINVSCEVAEVYPDIICRIFPQIKTNFQMIDSSTPMARFPELVNVTYIKRRLKGNGIYYTASCSSKFYTTEPGSYQFQVEMYSSKDAAEPIANITTNALVINGAGVYYKQSNHESKPGLVEPTQAFYALIGSILILAVSVCLIVSWIIWTKRCRCHSSSTATPHENEYESINDNVQEPTLCNIPASLSDEGYGESTGGDVVVADSETDEDTYPQKLLEERGYVPNITLPMAHIRRTTGNVYIDPVTPTSTLSRSIDEQCDGGLYTNADNEETHSKLCM